MVSTLAWEVTTHSLTGLVYSKTSPAWSSPTILHVWSTQKSYTAGRCLDVVSALTSSHTRHYWVCGKYWCVHSRTEGGRGPPWGGKTSGQASVKMLQRLHCPAPLHHCTPIAQREMIALSCITGGTGLIARDEIDLLTKTWIIVGGTQPKWFWDVRYLVFHLIFHNIWLQEAGDCHEIDLLTKTCCQQGSSLAAVKWFCKLIFHNNRGIWVVERPLFVAKMWNISTPTIGNPDRGLCPLTWL